VPCTDLHQDGGPFREPPKKRPVDEPPKEVRVQNQPNVDATVGGAVT